MNNDTTYLVPHSIEAEQAVLGGLMLDNDTWETVSSIIKENDFYKKNHQYIYKAMEDLIKKNEPLDVLTVSINLKEKNKLNEIGGKDYLIDLIRNTPSAKNIATYSQILKNKSTLRDLIITGKSIIELSLDNKNKKITSLIDLIEKKIQTISAKHNNQEKTDLVNISFTLSKSIQKIEKLFEADSIITGIPSGFDALDKMTAGFHPAELVIIAGRPSMGKTTLVINIIENIIKNTHSPILMFSMEMPSHQIVMRFMSSLGGIELHKLRSGSLDDTDWPRLTKAVKALSGKYLFIDDSGSLTPFDVKSKARKIYKKYKEIGIIIIDYLQLMNIPGMDNKTTEISEISRSLKALSKELDVPIIVLSQLNRSLEQRINKRPIMSDLRESGAIEQDADLILFIYRDEMYNKNQANSEIAEIIIAKQRNGPTGYFKLNFFGKYSRFQNPIKI